VVRAQSDLAAADSLLVVVAVVAVVVAVAVAAAAAAVALKRTRHSLLGWHPLVAELLASSS